MAWIESHEELADHHKIQKLAKELKCSIPMAVGYVHLLWHYTIRASWQFGDLSSHSPASIARGCWFRGKPEVLTSALITANFLESNMVVHDWTVYAKHLIYQRLYNSKRRDRRFTDVCTHVDTDVVKATTKPNLTLPNHNKKQCRFSFDEIWNKYPNKDGRKSAERSFGLSVKTEDDWKDINKALDNYLQSEKVQKGFIKNGSTWFNNWRDWINYEGIQAQDGMTPKLKEALKLAAESKKGARNASASEL